MLISMGLIEQSDREHLAKVFGTVDTDNDGSLTLKDFLKSVASVVGLPPPDFPPSHHGSTYPSDTECEEYDTNSHLHSAATPLKHQQTTHHHHHSHQQFQSLENRANTTTTTPAHSHRDSTLHKADDNINNSMYTLERSPSASSFIGFADNSHNNTNNNVI